MYEYTAELVRVIDGDTIEVVLDLGFHVSVRHVLRLAGVNCAEASTDAGRAASKATRDWFSSEGSRVTVRTQRDRTEKYGRFLAEVRSSHGRDLCADLIAAGHAVRWYGRNAGGSHGS